MDVKISVIVPIYNVANYLADGLESLLRQSLKELEIICVDDASTDDSLAIVKKYMATDNRIKLLENPTNTGNRGLGHTRGRALAMAVGKYVAFMDSDDYLDSDALEICYDKLEQSGADMVVFGFREVAMDAKPGDQLQVLENNWQQMMENSQELTGRQIVASYLSEPILLRYVVWNKVYRRSLLQDNHIKPIENLLFEDIAFVFEACYYAKKALIIPYIFANYRIRKEAITRNVRANYIDYSLAVANYIIDFMRERGVYLDYKEDFYEHFWKLHFNFLSYRSRHDNQIAEDSPEVQQAFNRHLQSKLAEASFSPIFIAEVSASSGY